MRSSGAEKKKIAVALTCTGNGEMLPAVAIFKGKRKLKFKSQGVSMLQFSQKDGWIQI